MSQFGKLTASELFCPLCQKSQPVRESLLLVLPDGELYEFVCTECGMSLGKRTVSNSSLPKTERVEKHNSKLGQPRRLLT